MFKHIIIGFVSQYTYNTTCIQAAINLILNLISSTIHNPYALPLNIYSFSLFFLSFSHIHSIQYCTSILSQFTLLTMFAPHCQFNPTHVCCLYLQCLTTHSTATLHSSIIFLFDIFLISFLMLNYFYIISNSLCCCNVWIFLWDEYLSIYLSTVFFLY